MISMSNVNDPSHSYHELGERCHWEIGRVIPEDIGSVCGKILTAVSEQQKLLKRVRRKQAIFTALDLAYIGMHAFLVY